MLDMKELLAFSVEAKASDVHIAVGIPPKLRINGKLTEVEVPALSPADAAEAIGSTMKDRHKAILQDRGEVDFSFDSPETGRFRVNVFMDKGNMAAAYRRVETQIPRPDQLGIPREVVELYKRKRGLVLVTGPTGSGKTYLVKTLAKLLDVPLAIADATSLTEAGYIGDDIESVVSKLLAAAGNDVEKAEKGIIFIDEIDKIAKKKNTNSRDVSGESVQQGMLKLLEGAEVEVPVGANSKNAMVPLATVNTRNILFICGGAFPDLDEIIKERLTKTASIGFNSELKDKYDKDTDILSKVTVEDIRKFGMIPEFLGRLPVTVTLQGLTKEFLVRILKELKNAILKQYKKLLAMDEVNLNFDDDALEWIAEQALKKDTGARALRAIIEEFMLDIMFEIPKDPEIGSVTITRAYLEKHGGPRIEMREYSTADKKAAALPGPTEACYKAE